MAFANFIAHLQSAGVSTIVAGEYQGAVDTLDLSLKRTAVEEAYLRVVAAIKQWAFPFAERFLSGIPDLEKLDDAAMKVNLPLILNNLAGYQANITTMDQAIFKGSFNAGSAVVGQGPFMTWSYADYPKEVELLLKGQPVILTSDIGQATQDAVKFRILDVKLKCMLDAKQRELNSLLQAYQVSLVHSGVSYYKYAGNFYRIQSDGPIDITYSFKLKDGEKIPDKISAAWEKMSAGNMLLSPYAPLILHITPADRSGKVTNLYDRFKDVISDFSISLVGEGCYVDAAKVNGDLHLEKYYPQVTEVETLQRVEPILTQFRRQASSSSLTGQGRRRPASGDREGKREKDRVVFA